jgi:signal transduction histidine kinase
MLSVKRFALFGATVVFPCVLLVLFGYRMIRQDRELAARHAEDEKRARALEQHQSWLAELEKNKRIAVEQFFAGRKPPVEFAALVIDQQIRTPWERLGVIRSATDSCERVEFAVGRLPEAIVCYRRGLAEATALEQRAYTRMLLGRALLKAGDLEGAARENLELLRTPFSLLDEQGVPFAWYAADRLLRSVPRASGVADRFREERIDVTAQSAPSAYLLQSIAERLGDASLQRKAAVARTFAEHVELLRADLPSLLPFLRRDGPESEWLPHGDWLIGLSKAPESGKELLVAIASNRVQPRMPLQQSSLPPPRTGIYVASFCLVFVIVASGAYLLWRDVRRDVAISNLRSQFVSSVSHELKTPLTAIRMFAEMLRMRPGSDLCLRQEYLDTIVNESERLSRLVDNVLDFSKIEQGRRLYRLQPTSLAVVIDSVVRAVRYPLQQAGYELRVTSDDLLPVVNADADALQQAVLNLLTNAMKYSTTQKQIDLAVERRGGIIAIDVRDYGIGIPAEHRRRIFERFYRVPTAENQRVPGAGLGLTLVAHIAKAHGGEVVVESEPGAGSLFSLHLPVGQQA